MSAYDHDLDKNAANFQPLTPLSFLERSAAVYPDRWFVVDGSLPAADITSLILDAIRNRFASLSDI